MLELTPDNAPDYFRDRGWASGDVTVSVLAGGVSNVVLRVETTSGRFVLKQSCPQLRTRDTWLSDVARVYREQEVMELLAPLVPDGVVPRVLHADRDNYAFAMTHAPLESETWKTALFAGDFDPTVADRAGALLGRIHQVTADDANLAQRFGERAVFDQLRITPFYRRVRDRHPDLAGPLDRLIERMETSSVALCHGDFTPKNLLVHRDGITLVDYETAHIGDPTMDLGLFLAHLLLKAMILPDHRDAILGLTGAVWQGYAREVAFRPLPELEAQAIEHLGACLLARVDGTSPVEYLRNESQRGAVRRLGREMLRNPPRAWDEVAPRMTALWAAG